MIYIYIAFYYAILFTIVAANLHLGFASKMLEIWLECTHFCASYHRWWIAQTTRSMRSRNNPPPKKPRHYSRRCMSHFQHCRRYPWTVADRKKWKFHRSLPICLTFSTNDGLNKQHGRCGHVPKLKKVYLKKLYSRRATPLFPRFSLLKLGRRRSEIFWSFTVARPVTWRFSTNVVY